MFVLFFYVLSPVPTIIARRLAENFDSSSNACVELCIFLTTGIVISSIGLPIVLAHTSVVSVVYTLCVCVCVCVWFVLCVCVGGWVWVQCAFFLWLYITIVKEKKNTYLS